MPLEQTPTHTKDRPACRKPFAVFSGGAIIGVLGGLIGLGGPEFRLPLLIGAFGFEALEAVMLNKAMSLVVVASALPFRAAAVPFSNVLHRYDVLITLYQEVFSVPGWLLTCAGVLAGIVIGIVAALLGVAGGELLIPTVMLLFGAVILNTGSFAVAIEAGFLAETNLA